MADPDRVRLDACVDLTRTATRQQYARGLSAWRWAGVERQVPLFMSLFGDVFLESYDGYWWLDSVRGTLVKPWETIEDLEADLDSARGQVRYLRSRLVLDAELQGLLPEEGQLYGFTVAPALGGIIIGYEVARSLGVRSLFAERKDGEMTLRRGFSVEPGERALIVEDVVTTGGSVREVSDLLKAQGAVVVGFGFIVDRSQSEPQLGAPARSLHRALMESYDASDCPLCEDGTTPAVKPGSKV